MLKNKLKIMVVLLCIALPLTATADDTSIYGTTTSTIAPNVLIILDNSGSMTTNDVQVAYNPAVTYSGTSTTNAVYYYKGTTTTIHGRTRTTWAWTLLTSSINTLTCAQVVSDLQTQGFSNSTLNLTNYSCTSSVTYQIRLGNFMNYSNNSSAQWETRSKAAVDALTALVSDPLNQNKNFGLMVYNPETSQKYNSTYNVSCWVDGGKLLKPCGTAPADIISAANAISFTTFTPLAETLAEAGRYFAGLSSWYNPGVTYTSPITQECQKNYIIIITDGEFCEAARTQGLPPIIWLLTGGNRQNLNVRPGDSVISLGDGK